MNEIKLIPEINEAPLDSNQNVVKSPLILPFMDTIDLTEDDSDEPVAKKIVLNSLDVVNRIATQPSTSSASINPHPEDQPGPSRRINNQGKHKRGACSKCLKTDTFHVKLDCGHRTCYQCFVFSLRLNTATVNTCPLLLCQQNISDETVKNALMPADYISFLEHTRNILRKALQAHEKSVPADAEADASSLRDSLAEISTAQKNEILDQFIIDIDEIASQDLDQDSQRRRSELVQLLNLETESYVKNFETFECPVCFNDIAVGDGLVLKNCLHSFCVECISESVKHSVEPVVNCPFYSKDGNCEFLIQEREIRAIVPQEIYDLHLSKALKRGEINLDNIFHCKTPDCIGFIQHDNDVTAFNCEVCEKVNCIKCVAIHEEKSCEQYQDDLKNDVKNQQELKLTEEAVKVMIETGEVRITF